MKEIFAWWFSPRRTYSILKIPLGSIIVVLFVLSVIGNFRDFIGAFRTEPLFTGLFLLFLPIFLFVFFADTIVAGGLFYYPYNVFEEEHAGWKSLLKIIGILIVVFIVLRAIRLFAFAGWE